MLIPTGYGQINHRFSIANSNRPAEVTMGFFNVSSVTDPLALAATAHAAFDNAWMGDLSVDLVLNSTLVKLGPNETGDFAEFVDPRTGDSPGGALAPNTAILVKKNTGFGGRQGRGRSYIPGIMEDNVDGGGNIAGATLETYNLDAAAWFDALNTAEMSPTLLHSEGPGETTVPFTITSLVVQQKVATQRRRLRR